MKTLWKAEKQKLRRRHVGLLYLLLLAVIFLWLLWVLYDRSAETGSLISENTRSQGAFLLLLNLPLMNATLLPIVLAAAESRLCDMELSGNTLKMLCTMQHRQGIYLTKLLFGLFYLLGFALAETAMVPLLCTLFQVEQPLPYLQLWQFFFSTVSVGTVLVILQQSLSLLFENQLLPLFMGVGGSFAGLFSWFFPLPIRYLLPWGYLCVGCTVNLDYNEITRHVTYYPIPFPVLPWLGFLAFGILVLWIGNQKFMKKEI